MDRLITVAWRVFWVGLGASTVLIAQTLMTAPSSASADHDSAAQVVPAESGVSERSTHILGPRPARAFDASSAVFGGQS